MFRQRSHVSWNQGGIAIVGTGRELETLLQTENSSSVGTFGAAKVKNLRVSYNHECAPIAGVHTI